MTDWQRGLVEIHAEQSREVGSEPLEQQDLRIVFGLAVVALQLGHREARVPYLAPSRRGCIDDQTAMVENNIRKKLTIAALQDPQGVRRPAGEAFWVRQLIREYTPELAKDDSKLKTAQASLSDWWGRRFRIAGKRVIVGDAAPLNNRNISRGFFKVSEKFNITDIVVE